MPVTPFQPSSNPRVTVSHFAPSQCHVGAFDTPPDQTSFQAVTENESSRIRGVPTRSGEWTAHAVPSQCTTPPSPVKPHTSLLEVPQSFASHCNPPQGSAV